MQKLNNLLEQIIILLLFSLLKQSNFLARLKILDINILELNLLEKALIDLTRLNL